MCFDEKPGVQSSKTFRGLILLTSKIVADNIENIEQFITANSFELTVSKTQCSIINTPNAFPSYSKFLK